MDFHKINKIRTIEDYSNSQFKLNVDTKRTLKNQQTLEIKFREEVKATPRTTTGVKPKSYYGIEEKEITEVSKDSGFVQLVFDDGSKTNETPFSQHSPFLGRNVKRSREQQFNVNQIEIKNCQNADNICENEIERKQCPTNILNPREKPLEEGTNINNENKSLQRVVTNIESFDIDNFVAKLTHTDVLEILKENHQLTSQPRQDKKLNKKRLSLKRKRKESDKSVINNEESSEVPEKIYIDEQIETPLIKRRRKHSAKAHNLTEADICITETEENTRNSTFMEREDILVNRKSDSTPYKKLVKIRKDRAARNLFKRKSSSRKSFAFNLVDKLNAVVDNDPKIVLDDVKRVNKTDVYDFTSSSESDKNFKKKKIVTRSVKRVNKSNVYDATSSTEANKDLEKKKIVTSTVKRVNKSDVYDVSNSAEAGKDFEKKKIFTRTVKRMNKSNVYDVTSGTEANKDFEKKNIVTGTVKRVNKSNVNEVTSSAEADKDFEKKKIVARPVKRVNKSDIYDVSNSAEASKDFEKKEIVTRPVKRVNKSDVNDVTSSAEADKDFEKKKIFTRPVKRVNKSDIYDVSNSAEASKDFEKKKIDTFTEKQTPRPRSKVLERTRSKSKMQLKMVDEWMRKAEPFYLNTSIAQELYGQETVIDTEVEPVHNKPRVFISPDHVDSEKATKTLKWNKKSKEIFLPGLEMESIPAFTKHTHSIDSDKLDNICDDHLHKSEQVNDNCTLTKVNIASNLSQRTFSDISHKELVVLDELDEKSISTAGISPITAHGVDRESPPKIDDITRKIPPRNLEAEILSEKARGYYHQLLEDMDQSEKNRCSRPCDKPKKDKILCLSIPRLPLSELRRYSREPHEVKSADPSASPHSNRQVTSSELSGAETLRSNVNPSDSEAINREPLIKPITQVKENVDFKIGNTHALDSKSLTFKESVKENHPSTSQPRQDASAEHRSVASSVYDWFQRNESAKPRTADDINELVDMIISKIESTLPEILKNTNALLVQLVETLIAEFMDQASDILRRSEQAAAKNMRQLIQEIQALKPDARNL